MTSSQTIHCSPSSNILSDDKIFPLNAQHTNWSHHNKLNPPDGNDHGGTLDKQSSSHQLQTPSRTTQWPGVIDELNWMLVEAIDSAQSTFGLPPDPNPQHQSPSISPKSSSYSLLSNQFNNENRSHNDPILSSFKFQTHQSLDSSQEDLDQLITSSSHLNHSDSSEKGNKAIMVQKSVQNPVSIPSSSGMASIETQSQHPMDHSNELNLIHDNHIPHGVTGLTKYQLYDCPVAPISESTDCLQPDASRTIDSEKETISPPSSGIMAPSVKRSPSFKLNNFITRKYKGLVSSRKSDPNHNSPPPSHIDSQVQTPKISSASPSKDSLPINSSMTDGTNNPYSDTPAKSLFQVEHPKFITSPSTTPKSLMARSAVVKRSSSDMNFLEQWQWLESQHPSSKDSTPNIDKIHSNSDHLTLNFEAKPNLATNFKETFLRALDHHFTSSSSAEDYFHKLAILSQRQQLFQQFRQHSNPKKFIKAPKPTVLTFEGVPTIDAKEFQKLKTSKDRYRIYEKKLDQLDHHTTGLDLWVWLQTRGQSRQISSPKKGTEFSNFSQGAPHRPFLHLHPSTGSPQQKSHSMPPFMRDVSISSISSFPLRDGVVPHKAVQIQHGTEKKLVEVSGPEVSGHRTHGMIVNSLMEVNNLPYPSLYPHSTNWDRRLSPISSMDEIRSATKSIDNKSVLPKTTILESNSKSTSGGFFSQLTRQNSSSNKKRNGSVHSLSTNNYSPLKSNNIKVCPTSISAPISTPKGPRPENGILTKHSQNLSYTGDLPVTLSPQMNHQIIQHQPALSIGSTTTTPTTHEMIQHQHESERLKLHSNQINQRMSFSYRTRNQQSPHKPTQNSEPVDHHGFDAPFHQADHLPSPINRNSSSSQSISHLHQQVELKSKVQKLLDILPNADKNLLEKILIESNLNDIMAIGTYLKLSQVRKS